MNLPTNVPVYELVSYLAGIFSLVVLNALRAHGVADRRKTRKMFGGAVCPTCGKKW